MCQPFDNGDERGYSFTATGMYRRLGVKALASVNVGGGPKGIRSSVNLPDLGDFALIGEAVAGEAVA